MDSQLFQSSPFPLDVTSPAPTQLKGPRSDNQIPSGKGPEVHPMPDHIQQQQGAA
jgi:hypothetical protein